MPSPWLGSPFLTLTGRDRMHKSSCKLTCSATWSRVRTSGGREAVAIASGSRLHVAVVPGDPRTDASRTASMATDLRALADEDLMPLLRRGDAAAFEVIYDRHASAAFSLAYRMMGTRGAAEDVTQEAFLSLWRSGAAYDR